MHSLNMFNQHLDNSKLCFSPNTSDNDNNYSLFNSVQKSDFWLIHQNIRSMRRNLDSFLYYLNLLESDPLMILLSEIFIDECESGNYRISNYDLYTNCNVNNKNAGFAVYIRQDVNCKVTNLNLISADGIKIDFTLNGIQFVIFGLYRLHEFNYDIFVNEMSDVLNNTRNKNVILIGDINIDIKSETSMSSAYLMCLASFGLRSLHTRITETSKTCLDHIFARNSLDPNFEYIADVVDLDVTDHCAEILKIKFNTIVNKNSNEKTPPDTVSKISFEKLNAHLLVENWSAVYQNQNVNEAYSEFAKILNNHISNCTTVARKKPKQGKIKEWMSNSLLNLLTTKNNLFKKVKLHPTHINLKKRYLKLKKHVESLIKIEKNNYYSNLFLKINGTLKCSGVL